MKAILFFGQHKKKLHKGPFKDYSQQNCLVLNKRDVRLSQSNALLAQQSFSISDQNHNYLWGSSKKYSGKNLLPFGPVAKV